MKRLGEVTKDTPRYEQVLKGLITQVSISSHWTKIKKSKKEKENMVFGMIINFLFEFN